MNLMISQNPYEFFQFCFTFLKIPFFEKNWCYNRATVNSITQKILVCDIESCYRNISEIRNVTSIFQNCQKIFKNSKNSEHEYEYELWKINKVV